MKTADIKIGTRYVTTKREAVLITAAGFGGAFVGKLRSGRCIMVRAADAAICNRCLTAIVREVGR